MSFLQRFGLGRIQKKEPVAAEAAEGEAGQVR